MYFAKEGLLLLYGNESFIAVTTVLRLILLVLVPRALTAVLGRTLLAGKREKAVLQIVLVDAAVMLVSGFVFIRHYGLIGAALSAIAFASADLLLHYWFVRGIYTPVIPWWRFWKAAVASLCLWIFLAVWGRSIGSLVLAVASGGAIYGLALLVLERSIRSPVRGAIHWIAHFGRAN
jgi:O-antigen/teichoic acid export membrane protein